MSKQKEPEIISDWSNEAFRVGRFTWIVDNNCVIVTKDVKNGLFETIALYEYKDYETAAENAWKMACRQIKA